MSLYYDRLISPLREESFGEAKPAPHLFAPVLRIHRETADSIGWVQDTCKRLCVCTPPLNFP